jgi:Zn-dependent M28 family amino/carboxypeptidase
MRIWVFSGILVVLAILAVIGYRVMIDVKPDVTRPTMTPAIRADIAALEARLMPHVRMLGGTIGQRHLARPNELQAAAEHIRKTWTDQGFTVKTEAFQVDGRPCENLIIELRGVGRPQEIVLVGAHYDTAPGTPGANDNGSGVALLLEMSRAFRQAPLQRTLRFVAFTNEEPPHFFTEDMGSRVHARNARQRGEAIVAMVSLETIGYYSDASGGQSYPFPFGLLYPSAGNFLAVVGNLPSRPLAIDFLRAFMAVSDFPVEGVATFEMLPGINWSDHWSFWKEGYPALMLTDTAPFRYPHYHAPEDIPDKLTPPAFARVGHGIIQAVRHLASPR